MSSGSPTGPRSGGGMFGRLGRWVVRHPWYPIIFWVVLTLIAVPFLGRLNDVTTNSATTLPSSAPSQIAAHEIDRLFPNQSGGSDSLLLFTGSNVTSPASQHAIEAVTAGVSADPHLLDFAGAESVYTAYGSYQAGMTRIALVSSNPTQNATGQVARLVNQTAQLVWGPSALYVATWSSLVSQNPGTNPTAFNFPAYNSTRSALAPNPLELDLLVAFYNGYQGNGSGFNGTAACAAAPATVVACADNATRANDRPVLALALPPPTQNAIWPSILAGLDVADYRTSSAQFAVTTGVVASVAGLPPRFVGLVLTAFPSGLAGTATVAAWSDGIVTNGTLDSYPLPVPASILSSFVSPGRDASLVVVTFSQSDSYTAPNGSTPVYDDVQRLDAIVPPLLAQHDPGHTLAFVQTGGAPLDQFESVDLSQNLSIVLPLTIAVLIVITLLYFRSPITPLATFTGLGIAIGLGLAGAVLLGTLVSKFDVTTLTLENTFVLGVGTDYSVFLVARYREELFKGAPPKEAVVTAVTWAGQSIATSGATAVIATLALSFSGLALLSQWGMVLSLAILITVLVSLTLVPALLVLIGPRVFWPVTGSRFARLAKQTVERRSAERTYFYRAGRSAQRRPKAVAGLILLASLPLFYVALNVPLSYDFYSQLPNGHPSTDGFHLLEQRFGPGFAFPIATLVSFRDPLVVGNTTNGLEFSDLGTISSGLTATSGVASVQSPVGPAGAPLGTWTSFSNQSPGTRAQLRGILASYVGTDGRTVLLNVISSSGGLTAPSVNLLRDVESYLHGFAASHSEVTGLAFGGGASVTYDLSQQTALSTERLAIAVSIGLLVVLLVVLRSAVIPLLAIATIGLSIGWAWATTYLVLDRLLGFQLFYFVPTVLFLLILGLGIDYNIFLLTRVREERLRGHPAGESVVHAVASTGGIITAAAVILASAFAILTVGDFVILKAIGFAVAAAVLLDAMVVRTYLVPALLQLLGERAWAGFRRRRPERPRSVDPAPEPSGATAPTS